MENHSRVNKLQWSMGSQSPTCMLHGVRGKGKMILHGRGNRNRSATKLFPQESLIRVCMENPNRITMLPQEGNRIKRESPCKKLLLALGHPTGHSATGKYAKYRNLPKEKSEFFAPPSFRRRDIPLSSVPSFRFRVHIIFFLLCGNHPSLPLGLFLPCSLSKISFLISPSNNMHHRTGKSRLPPHYKNEQFSN